MNAATSSPAFRLTGQHAVLWLLRAAALILLLLPCIWMLGAAFTPTLERLDHPLGKLGVCCRCLAARSLPLAGKVLNDL